MNRTETLTPEIYTRILEFLLDSFTNSIFSNRPCGFSKNLLIRDGYTTSQVESIVEKLLEDKIVFEVKKGKYYAGDPEGIIKANNINIEEQLISKKVDELDKNNYETVISTLKKNSLTIGKLAANTSIDLVECRYILDNLIIMCLVSTTSKYKNILEHPFNFDTESIIRNIGFISAYRDYHHEQIEKHEKEINEPYLRAAEEGRFSLYGFPAYFPWLDVVNSYSNELPDDALKNLSIGKYSKVCCTKCGANVNDLKKVYFRSPPWSWKEMCGREGLLFVCEKCLEQVEFDGYLMN